MSGFEGMRGNTGVKGFSGLKGETGVFGHTGPKGVSGQKGSKGETNVPLRCFGIYRLKLKFTHNHMCILPGDRGLRGPPGEKPKVSPQIIDDMKGAKGEQGPYGTHGFTGQRGQQPLFHVIMQQVSSDQAF